MITEKYVKCIFCGDKTEMLGTKLCDSCWELKRRIDSNPEIARNILVNKKATRKLR